MNVLFVCTLNKARSVTEERLYRRMPGLSVRSAGTSDRAAHQVTESDLTWADRVIVFEAAHEQWIRATFSGELPEIVDVGVVDDYNADEPPLIAELKEVVSALIGPTSRSHLCHLRQALVSLSLSYHHPPGLLT